jgi:Cu2+-containing amine oxidase
VEITHKRRSVTTQQEALNQTMIRPSIMSHQNMTLLENQSRPLLNITSETQMKQAVKINELKLHFEKAKQDRENEFLEIRKAEKLEFDLTVKKLEKDNLLRVEIQDQKIAELTS